MNKWIAALSFLLLSQAINAQSLPARDKAKLDSLLQSIYAASLPGASIAIMQNGKSVFEKSYGVRNTITKEKITDSTSFNIASLTKQFTAMAILQLYEQDKLTLSDHLSRFFPDMERTVADVVTVQQLLTHSSGILDHYGYVDTKGMKHAHDSDVYVAIQKLDSLYFNPDTKFRYSNTGYCLLALIVERASGLSYSNYMQKNIFQPAGMLHTKIWNETNTIFQPAIGYDKDSASQKIVPSGADEHIFFSTEGDGGIYTSIHDYLLWLKALQEGKLFNKNIVDKARSTEFLIQPELKFGYGFGWFIDDSEADRKVYHSGSNGVFRTYSFTIPEEDFSIVVFSNRSDIDVEQVVQKIYSLLYPDRKPFVPIEILTS